MAFAIELFFDRDGENRIQALWQKLAESRVSSFLLDLWARPHLSLAVFDEADPGRLKPAIQEFAAAHAPLELQFCSVGAFPGDPAVVFIQPVITRELLDMHERFHAILPGCGVESHLLYSPGKWMPHCSVAQDLARGSIGRAVELVHAAFPLGTARCVELGLIEYRPVRELFRFRLRGVEKEN